MRALKRVGIRFLDREVNCTALFDSGSGITAVQRKFFEESFGAKWLKIVKPIKLYWINGEFIQVDKYAQITIIVNGFALPETAFIIDGFIEEIEVESGKIRLPELVIGSGTMDKYGITLDLREGVKLTGATLLL
jgi:hypothetical protein